MTDMKPLSCEAALRLLAVYLDSELEPVDERAVEEHIARCRSCFSRAEFERRLKHQLSAIGRQPVDPTFANRIRALINRFASGESATRRG
ncbi:MAG: anti-sigma factor family protein [Longimicrobiales bacterium]